MGFKDLTSLEMKVYEFVRDRDYHIRPWITSDAARELNISEEELYTAMSELSKKIRDNFWIYYDSGHLHVVAD